MDRQTERNRGGRVDEDVEIRMKGEEEGEAERVRDSQTDRKGVF